MAGEIPQAERLNLGDKFVMQNINEIMQMEDHHERLKQLKRYNKDASTAMKSRAEGELRAYATECLKNGDEPIKDPTPEQINQKIAYIKKASFEMNQDNPLKNENMGFILASFLANVGKLEAAHDKSTDAVVAGTAVKQEEVAAAIKAQPVETPAVVTEAKLPEVTPVVQAKPVVEVAKATEATVPLESNVRPRFIPDISRAKIQTDTLLINGPLWELVTLSNLPWVSFIKYDDQGKMNAALGRMTAFTEQWTTNFSDAKTWNYPGWHDLSSKSIADYLNIHDGKLAGEEQDLREKLIWETIISYDNASKKYVAIENKALLAMYYPKQDAKDAPRIQEMVQSGVSHELAHGLYFTNPEFKALTDNIWNQLNPAQKEAISGALKKNYGKQEFHATEFLSYILFTGDKTTIIENLVWYDGVDQKDVQKKQAYTEQQYNDVVLPIRKVVLENISKVDLSPQVKSFIDTNKVSWVEDLAASAQGVTQWFVRSLQQLWATAKNFLKSDTQAPAPVETRIMK